MIYLDNAATTWPKPAIVYDSVLDAMKNKGGNPGRSGHFLSMKANKILDQTRFSLSKLFSIDDLTRIVFCLNATDALNLGINGIVKKGDHVITSTMEHNSVTRPLEHLRKFGVEIDKVHMDQIDGVKTEDINRLIKKNTKLIVITHASNVTGTVNPISEIGSLCKKKNIIFLVDASQSAGSLDIDVDKMNIDLLAFPGHKGLLGPSGTGGLYIKDSDNISLIPSRYGGTGIYSEMPLQPEQLPFYYESGTQNSQGLAGLNAGVEFILNETPQKIHHRENKLISYTLDRLNDMKDITIYGPNGKTEQASVISININGVDCTDAAAILDTSFDIAVRSGLHCAPDAHKTLGTFDQGGTLRISPGYFNNFDEIDKLIDAIKEISEELGS